MTDKHPQKLFHYFKICILICPTESVSAFIVFQTLIKITNENMCLWHKSFASDSNFCASLYLARIEFSAEQYVCGCLSVCLNVPLILAYCILPLKPL